MCSGNILYRTPSMKQRDDPKVPSLTTHQDRSLISKNAKCRPALERQSKHATKMKHQKRPTIFINLPNQRYDSSTLKSKNQFGKASSLSSHTKDRRGYLGSISGTVSPSYLKGGNIPLDDPIPNVNPVVLVIQHA